MIKATRTVVSDSTRANVQQSILEVSEKFFCRCSEAQRAEQGKKQFLLVGELIWNILREKCSRERGKGGENEQNL
jgi:hypothetical protein